MREADTAGRARLLLPSLLCLVVIFWLGMRPATSAFGDTANYALEYSIAEQDVSLARGAGLTLPDWSLSREWVFDWLMRSCALAGWDVSAFFTIVEAGYVLFLLLAVARLFPKSPMLGLLFAMSSLMYYSYGINGIRNGLACHLVLLAITYLFTSRYTVAALLCLLAVGIHRTTLLPIASVLAGIFLLRDVRLAVYLWAASIAVSLVAGNAFTQLVASIGIDERMEHYGLSADYADEFSSTGFRWDFLLYSFMPVLLAWYVVVRRRLQDNWYNVLAVAYCLSNAFWVLVIRAEFSNRFAYLSWFLYPIVIAYPLICMPVWKDQDRRAGLILLLHCGFTLFMNLYYWKT